MNETNYITCQLTAVNEEATAAIARSLAHMCHSGDTLLLEGDVGMGKTTFARSFISEISSEKTDITSPTFTLLQTYPLIDGGTLWHFDLYRLKHREELVEIGLHEALENGITLIEWPQLAMSELPDSALEITLLPGLTHDQRIFSLSGMAPVWKERLGVLKETMDA
jgi:tRNA threonylcarbamoyladenosine biosynthesis protein TsaE